MRGRTTANEGQLPLIDETYRPELEPDFYRVSVAVGPIRATQEGFISGSPADAPVYEALNAAASTIAGNERYIRISPIYTLSDGLVVYEATDGNGFRELFESEEYSDTSTLVADLWLATQKD